MSSQLEINHNLIITDQYYFCHNCQKLFEHLLDSFQKKYIINESQYGFQSGWSIAMAITDLVGSVTDALDKNVTIGIFIDLKAFDAIK